MNDDDCQNLAPAAVRTDGPSLEPPESEGEPQCRECGEVIAQDQKHNLCDDCTAGALFDAKAEIIDQQSRLNAQQRALVELQRERDDQESRANLCEQTRAADRLTLSWARGYVRSMWGGRNVWALEDWRERVELLAAKLGADQP